MPISFLKNWTIDLTRMTQYTVFKGKFELELDYHIMVQMGQSTNPIFTDNNKRALLNIINKTNMHTNILEVEHKQRYGIGRFYPENQISPICLSRHMKHTLFTYLDWIDIDMVKGHPTILYNIAKNNNIQTPAIKHYIDNFDEVITNLQTFYTPDESIPLHGDIFKDIFCRLIYGGGVQAWFDDLDGQEIILKTNTIHSFITDFKTDIGKIMQLVYLNNEALLEKIKGTVTDEYKLKARVMSYFCGAIENEIINVTYKVLLKNNIIKPKQYALEYDGLCFKRPENENLDELINKINTAILEKTGLDVKMRFKPYNPMHIHTDIIEGRENMLPPLVVAEAIDNPIVSVVILSDLDTLYTIETYEQFKIIFERTHFKCRNNAMFYKQEYTDTGVFIKLIQYTEHTLKTANREFNQITISDRGAKKIKYHIDTWYDDKNIRVYEDLDCYPPPIICPKNMYNTWTSFDVETLTYFQKDEYNNCIIPEEEYEYIETGYKFILEHISKMCGNDEIAYNYFIKWIGFLFKYPAIKCSMPHIVGGMGAGKSGLLKFFTNIIGSSKVLVSSEPEKNVWGHFNGGMAHVYLTILEELTEKKTMEYDSVIKDLVTGSTINLNQKGEKEYTMKSYHKFIATGNGNTIKTVRGDRRNFMINVCNIPKDDTYFTKFFEYIAHSGIQMVFYERMCANPEVMSTFPSIPIPITEYQRTLQNANREECDLFLEHYVNGHCNEGVLLKKSMEVYLEFNQWKEMSGYEYKMTCCKFIRNLKLLSLPNNALDTHINDATLHRRDANYIRVNIPILNGYYKNM